MLMRRESEAREGRQLAAYAVTSAASKGRQYPETECEFRTCFQRDRDRIVHSSAFRRLEYKTQVFVNHEGDYYRTRLTHSLEVAQIARSIARTMRLNEDLSEVIALAHDLGHTPFGHSGEEVLNRLLKEHGGFEHNRQSFRIVTLLEHRYPGFPGLNLSVEVLEGVAKHETLYDKPNFNQPHSGVEGGGHTALPGGGATLAPTIEAQIVNLADEIAYSNHDLDDGLQSRMLNFEGLASVKLWRSLFDQVLREFPDADGKVVKVQTIRRLIHHLIRDVQKETDLRIKDRNIQTLNDVRRNGKALVGFSQEVQDQFMDLKRYLFKNMYRHYRVERMAHKAENIIEDLFTTYCKNPRLIPPGAIWGREDSPLERKVADYIAGMTDRFALDEHAKLFDPHAKV